MSIYTGAPVDDEPTITLGAWSIRETNTGNRHFVGFNLASLDGRVSTPIVSFDPGTRTGVSASGRRYVLVGPAGFDRDAEYVWRWAVRAWNIERWGDVSATLVPDSRLPLSVALGEESAAFEAGTDAASRLHADDFNHCNDMGRAEKGGASDHTS
ncbi:hypothetical protein [Burkholderia pseudomallei]|uniref:hypothetical protein n=1 Tax=Burkholderia pseudomallei TaxID=28450 RepID=UPI000A1A0D77|nr:hypothetical protein [Burkholderia pseudomallei]ARL23929.1 hypothetical protein BOC47_17315 [Burkholderia pseudomallei]